MKDRPNLSKEQVEQLEEIGVIQEDRTEQEESLEELEGKLQGLVEKKKASSQLVSDFERVKKLKSANKGVEKQYMKNLLVESMQLNSSSLLELQKLFRNGIIKENDIPKEQLHELKKLYHEQINFLENSIEIDKQKILKIKNQLKL